MRFYLDEHVQNVVAEGLCSYGVDVITVEEAGRIGGPDEEQLAFTTIEGRVTMTIWDSMHAVSLMQASLFRRWDSAVSVN